MRGSVANRRFWLLGSVFLGVLAAQAHAQTVAQGSNAAADTAADATSVGELIVTATKRAESVQDVPLSISAVGADTLNTQNINDLSRLDVLVPGFKFGASGNDARPAIRGTRTQQVIGNADPVVAFYEDGIYRSRPGQQNQPFFDQERVEIARGPQGTLFGRNSFGGAVNVISKAPKLDQFDGGASVEGTNYSGVRAEGFVNIPLGDTLALRISAYESRRDSWVHNLANPGNSPHDDDNQAVRVQLKWQPNASFSNVARFDFWHGGGAGPGDFGYYAPGVPIDPATQQTNGVTGIIDPRISTVPGRGGGYGFVQPGVVYGDPNWRTVSTNFPWQRLLNQYTFSDEANLDLGFATLRGIFSYTDYYERRLGDPDYSSIAQDAAYNRVTTNTATEEIQIISKGESRLQWVIGGYFLQDRPTDLYVFGDDQSGRQGVDPGALGIPGLISTDPAQNNHNGYANLYVQGPFHEPTNSYAVYGDATYRILDTFRLLGGIRYTVDDRSATIENAPDAGYPIADTGVYVNNTEGPVSASFNHVTYRVGGQWDIAPHHMLYATYSTGFVAGGFSGAPSFDPTATSLTTYNPTTADAVEVGSKNTFDEGRLRLNISGYRNEYDNLVTQKLVQVGQAISTTTANAGTIRAWGVEGELDYNPTPALYLGLRAAYTHARFGDYVASNSFTEGANIPGVNAFQLRGLQVPLNPDFTLTALGSYDFDLGPIGLLTPSVTIYYSDSYRTSDQPYFFANQPSYATEDLYLKWKKTRDSKLSFEAFVNNLSDQRILLRTTPNAGQVIYQDFANPRIFGLRVSYNY